MALSRAFLPKFLKIEPYISSKLFFFPTLLLITGKSDTSSFLSKIPFSSHPIIWHSHKNELSLDIERESKEAFFMSKKLIKVGIGLGLLALGAAYLGKKQGYSKMTVIYMMNLNPSSILFR